MKKRKKGKRTCIKKDIDKLMVLNLVKICVNFFLNSQKYIKKILKVFNLYFIIILHNRK